MLDIFGEAGRISSMNYVFKLMQENGIKVDAVTYTSLMHWISSSGDVDGAVNMWQEMKFNGCNPTVVSYTAYLKILFDNKRVEEASDLYREMIQIGISPTCHTYTVLMEYLVSVGKCEEAMEIFSKMQESAVQPDKPACNILIQRCCKVGETKTMMRILQYMKENCLVLRYPVFLEALETLRAAGENDALLREVNPHISPECVVHEKEVPCVPTADNDNLDKNLALILLKKENLIAIDRLLSVTVDKHLQLDSVIISMIIEVNCDRCRFDGALLAFEYSVRMGLNLENYAYLALIGISIRSNTFLKVLEIVKEKMRAGHSLGVYHGALIIYRLGRARRPTLAAKIFNLLPDQQKCTATYTALISVYFSAGNPDKALKIYEIMRRRCIQTSLGTYNILLTGLEKSGKACETETYRKEKKRLLIDAASRDSVPMEEKMCDLLFAG
ncbi:putative pentatricopeptide repeat-containing protein [Tripterygium wilfordii]|uniref:Putative pentatricopeptide repeat-containing protein n=2 Tax=Tripterygium wilfordii TaxID=458696 RepID=A0A7J7CVQ4_TRIWF|nr:putative pentatricopeptide repeat-containing protein [Tripterygium wilfordii]